MSDIQKEIQDTLELTQKFLGFIQNNVEYSFETMKLATQSRLNGIQSILSMGDIPAAYVTKKGLIRNWIKEIGQVHTKEDFQRVLQKIVTEL